ncbi:MAG: NAD(P)H-hydrate epimerase [Candidatus Omnitrophota bacterium]|jgi:NAD(P)H-hydrate epimerase
MKRDSLYTLTALQAKAIDAYAQKKLGISTLVLMENAGQALAAEIMKTYRGGKVAVFCGRGNNGGDGFVCARHLLAAGITPNVFLIGKKAQVSAEARLNLEILLNLKLKVFEITQENLPLYNSKIKHSDLIVDALLGVGLSGEVRGVYRDVIGLINKSKGYCLSVDIPSGLDATTGKILGCCIKADKTVTFIACKRGMVIGEGKHYCGRVVVKNLGIPV